MASACWHKQCAKRLSAADAAMRACVSRGVCTSSLAGLPAIGKQQHGRQWALAIARSMSSVSGTPSITLSPRQITPSQSKMKQSTLSSIDFLSSREARCAARNARKARRSLAPAAVEPQSLLVAHCGPAKLTLCGPVAGCLRCDAHSACLLPALLLHRRCAPRRGSAGTAVVLSGRHESCAAAADRACHCAAGHRGLRWI